MGRMRPREKASVQDGRDDNDDAGDAQAKQGKPAFGSSEEATVVKVDEERAVDVQAKEGKAGFGSVDEAMEKSKLEQSKSTSLAAHAMRLGVLSGYDEDLQLLQGAERSTTKAKGKGKDRSLKVFRCVEDVEDEIARLKKPPRQLKKSPQQLKKSPRQLKKSGRGFKTIFKTEFGLQDEGDNPHHFRKNTVSAEILRKLFGKPYGKSGRAGYAWGDCSVQEVVDRVKYLHPILYQHGEDETPNLVTIRFAEGVALEYEVGSGKVNWCAFGEETNKRQRS